MGAADHQLTTTGVRAYDLSRYELEFIEAINAPSPEGWLHRAVIHNRYDGKTQCYDPNPVL